jgi:molecular chaperone DnaK (HSP70)
MRKDAEAHAEEDRKRKELIDARNTADNACYTAEKALKDLGDKVPADVKKKVEDEVAKVRGLLNSDDAEAIRKATDELFQVVQQIGASVYQQPGGPAAPAPGEGPQPGQQPGGEEGVVDGEFRNV